MAELLQTPLHALHVSLGAKMVPFAGYEMPMQYPLGVMKEHLHTRAHAGLFDVSHMGQVIVKGASYAAAAKGLEGLIPVDILDLAANRAGYCLRCSQSRDRCTRRRHSRRRPRPSPCLQATRTPAWQGNGGS